MASWVKADFRVTRASWVKADFRVTRGIAGSNGEVLAAAFPLGFWAKEIFRVT